MDAITKVKGPCIILAGAGTGKTYTIVEKIKYLTENKFYEPQKIACITFSNEACNNLALRIEKVLNLPAEEKNKIIIRTFHGFSSDILKKHGEKINISKNFKILDPEQAMVALYRNLKVSPPFLCKIYVETIGTAKDLGITLEDLKTYLQSKLKPYGDTDLEKKLENLNFELQTLHLKKKWDLKKIFLSEIKELKKIINLKKFILKWEAYEKLKQKNNFLDYADLNKYALVLLDKYPEIAQEFSYFIIDEFQDTNKLQLDLLVKIAPHKNITVVGDMNQSIYRFRGAYKHNLDFFKKEFSVTPNDIFNLEKSYRSPNTVLRTAYKLILKNYTDANDCLFVENANQIEGEKVKVFELANFKEEARKVVEIIKKEHESGIPFEEICVMYRAHQYSRIIKKALEKEGIPYYAAAKVSLLKQKSVKTAIDFLTILNKLKKREKGGEQEWWDLFYQLNFQRNDLIEIGKVIKKFTKNERENPLNNESKEKDSQTICEYFLENFEKLSLSSEGKIALKGLIEKIKILLPLTDKKISELLLELYRVTGLYSDPDTLKEKEAIANLSKLQEIAKFHEEMYDDALDNFLYYLQTLKTLEIDIDAVQLEESGVRLMSVHATKGLEFKVVILTNFAQGRFPIEKYANNSLIPLELMPDLEKKISQMSEEQKEEFLTNQEKCNSLLEERRLAYVSFTRAREKLYITFSREYSGKKYPPSQFLQEIHFENNPDIEFLRDLEIKYLEKEEANKTYFSQILSNKEFENLLEEMASAEDKKKEQQPQKFSPSALILFHNCQKEFEYRYVYNMPERKTPSWESIKFGSFIHLVLEKGVKAGFTKVEEFLQLAKELSMEEEWESISLLEAETAIKVFFERNKDKYSKNSLTEQYLSLQLGGLDFIGYADRIDFTPSGVQIVDYKTGKSQITPIERNWQLGFYALAAQQKFGKVKRVVLDMLKQDRPLEFEIDNEGNAICISSKFISGFNIYETEKELIDTAKAIQEAYKKGFKPCPLEKNCEFCNEYVYNL